MSLKPQIKKTGKKQNPGKKKPAEVLLPVVCKAGMDVLHQPGTRSSGLYNSAETMIKKLPEGDSVKRNKLPARGELIFFYSPGDKGAAARFVLPAITR